MYDQFAEDYDRFVNWKNRLDLEIPFIDTLLSEIKSEGPNPKKVLDSACGTGMHATALAKRGYDVFGADFSSAMIQKARENAKAEGQTVHFEIAGFGTLAHTFGNQQFNAILCLGNSLPHLLTLHELNAALDDFADCLKEGGLLLIQNRNFDSVMPKKERWMEPQTHKEGQNEWIFQRFYDFEPDNLIQFNIVTLKRSGLSPWSSSVTSTRLKPQLRNDLVSALTTAGFANIREYGSLTGGSFLPLISSNLVLAAKKLG